MAASNEPPNATPQDVFDGMRRSFQADKAKGVHLKFQWQLGGPNGGEWWIEVNDGKFEMGRGKIDKPDVTFITTDKNWVALSNGTLGGKWAFLMGLPYRATKNSRQSGCGTEAGRDISLAQLLSHSALGNDEDILVCRRSSRAFEHAGYCMFNFVTRDALHVASARWLLRMRARELQRDVACRFIQRTVIRGRVQVVE